MKLSFCEELENSIEIIEGSLSRTKGFLIMNYLKTLDYMKQKGLPIGQVNQIRLLLNLIIRWLKIVMFLGKN